MPVDFSASFWGPRKGVGADGALSDVTLIVTSPSFWQSVLDRFKLLSGVT